MKRAPLREVRSRVFDGSRWDGYRPRADDIIIGTYSKCGTTWMQRIVSMPYDALPVHEGVKFIHVALQAAFSVADLDRYLQKVRERFSGELADWLEHGSAPRQPA